MVKGKAVDMSNDAESEEKYDSLNTTVYLYDGRFTPNSGTCSSSGTKWSYLKEDDESPRNDNLKADRTPRKSVQFANFSALYANAEMDSSVLMGSATSSSHGQLSPQHSLSNDIMPSHDVVLREFEEYLEARAPMTEEDENKLRLKNIEEKWQLIFNVEKGPLHSPKMYTDNLQKHASSMRKKSLLLKKTDSNGASTVSFWLRKLKVDLKSHSPSFVKDFISKPLNGFTILLDVLRQIHKDQEKLLSSQKSKADSYIFVKADALKQTQLDEYDCLLCIKFALRSPESISVLLSSANSPVDLIATCLLGTFRKTTVVTMEILTALCDTHTGYTQVMDAITMIRLKTMESVRFKLIANMLHSQNINRHFQAVCVRFFNQLLSCTDNANAKVHLQYELSQAGFEPDALDRYSLAETEEYDELQHELDIWRKNYINVDNSHQELFELQNRNAYLRSEIDRLQANIKEVEEQQALTEKDKSTTAVRLDKHSEKIAELQDMLGRLVELYEDRTGCDPNDEIEELKNYYKPLDGYNTIRDNLSAANTSKSRHMGSLAPSGGVPDAPPMIPADFLSKTVRHKFANHGNLPTLGWTPLNSVRDTLFEDIDDEAKLREIDFSEFNKIFQLPSKEIESRDLGDRIVLPSSKKILFVEMSRARNMIITMKRTSLDPIGLKAAVDTFQIDKLPGDCAELLLKFIPNSFELSQLNEHRSEYHNLGEAEQYLYQMTKIERLERKLSLMAFIGKFDDVTEAVRPKIDLIHRSSDTIIKSLKLKKVFELILAFGNYMNSNKRGYALGFRLESLSKLVEVKARDNSKQTVLNYLVRYIETKYPELSDFGDELDLRVDKGVSFQSVASDVLGLRKGMDQLRLEREKQHDNPVLEDFYKKASPEVVEISDSFRKMEDSYKHVCAYFGERHREMEPDELIKYLTDFVAAFKGAFEENRRRQMPVPNLGEIIAKRRQESMEEQPISNGPSKHPVSPREINNNMNGFVSTNNLDTPTKNKPEKSKVVGVINSLQEKPEDLYDETLPPAPPKRTALDKSHPEKSAIYHDIPVRRSDSTNQKGVSRSGSYVTKINVTSSYENPYSEIPAKAPKLNNISRQNYLNKNGDIQPKGNSFFFYGAQTKDGPQPRKVQNVSSFREGNGSSAPNLRRTETVPAQTKEKPMVVKRVKPGNESSSARSSLISLVSQTEPIYDTVADIGGETPRNSMYYNGYTPSQTNSDSSTLSSPTMSDASSSAHKFREYSFSSLEEPRTKDRPLVNGHNDSRNILTQDFDDAIDKLDQVLDDAISGETVAIEDEFTTL